MFLTGGTYIGFSENSEQPVCPGICQSICLWVWLSAGLSVRLYVIHVSFIKQQKTSAEAGCSVKVETIETGEGALCLMIH